jgi:hypothetical protein
MLYLYDLWKTYDEKDQMKDILNRIQKPRLNSNSSTSRSSQQEAQ